VPGAAATVRIDRPPDEVWRHLLDPGRIATWMPDVIRLEKVTEGALGVGARYRETRRIGRQEHTQTLEVTAYEEGRRYAVTAEARGLRGTYTYALAPEDGGTRVDLAATLSGRGLMRLLAPFVARLMRRQVRDRLDRLKRAVEA